MQKLKKGKRRAASLAAVALAMVMGTSLVASTPFASADESSESSLTKYYTDFNSMEEAKTAAEDLTREIVAEGASLLKNKDNALPMNGSEWVSVFGVRLDNLIGNTYKHYLMLTDEEQELIDYVTSRFNKVIILTNTSNPMEIEELENNTKISAILHIGRPGVGGLKGMTDILTGLSPSGGLVAEWMSDFTTDPTWYNFGSNNQTGDATVGDGAGSNAYRREDGVLVGSAEDTGATKYDDEGYHGVDYE